MSHVSGFVDVGLIYLQLGKTGSPNSDFYKQFNEGLRM